MMLKPNLDRIIVCSTAGHDKGRFYLTQGWDDDRADVDLYNGENRTLSAPKKKNRKHLRVIRHLDEDIIRNIDGISRDEDIRLVLRMYRQSQSEVKNVKV